MCAHICVPAGQEGTNREGGQRFNEKGAQWPYYEEDANDLVLNLE